MPIKDADGVTYGPQSNLLPNRPKQNVAEFFERISTYCGSMTRTEFAEHIKECDVCAKDAEGRTDV